MTGVVRPGLRRRRVLRRRGGFRRGRAVVASAPVASRGAARGRIARSLLVIFVAVTAWVRFGPLPAAVTDGAGSGPIVVDRHGHVIGPPRSGDATSSVPLAERAPALAAAIVASEDGRFYDHIGIDPLALAESFRSNISARSIVRGGSTISQQLVKIRTGRTGRGLFSKAREALYAIRLEHRETKTEILSAYLAEAPFGVGIVGADAAAATYFGTNPAQLSWAQAAFLAALPQRPNSRDPRLSALGDTVPRQHQILQRLHTDGTIDEATLQSALSEVLTIRPITLAAPRAVALQASAAAIAEAPGERRIHTTLDGDLQADVEGLLGATSPAREAIGAAQAAVVVLDNHTGGVRAYASWGSEIDAAAVARQTGSTIKPFVYALAFDQGHLPSDVVADAPLRATAFDDTFVPENYDGRHRGDITLRAALASSVNIAAVEVLKSVGPERLGELMTTSGMRTSIDVDRYGLSLALGAAEVDLLSLTRAAAAFPRGGSVPTVHFVDAQDAAPEAPDRAAGSSRQIFSAKSAALVSDVLSDRGARAAAFGEWSQLDFPFLVSAKTGTSEGFRDNWVIGWNREVTVGVWVGNLDGTPLAPGTSGVSGAGPLFHAVFSSADVRLGPFPTATSSYTGVSSVPTSTVDTDAVGSGPSSSLPGRIGGLRLVTPSNGDRYLIPAGASSVHIPVDAAGGTGPRVIIVDGVERLRLSTVRRQPGAEPARSERSVELKIGSHEVCVSDDSGISECARIRVG